MPAFAILYIIFFVIILAICVVLFIREWVEEKAACAPDVSPEIDYIHVGVAAFITVIVPLLLALAFNGLFITTDGSPDKATVLMKSDDGIVIVYDDGKYDIVSSSGGEYSNIYSQFTEFIPGTEIEIHYKRDIVNNKKTYTGVEMTGYNATVYGISERIASGNLDSMILYDSEFMEQIAELYEAQQQEQQ